MLTSVHIRSFKSVEDLEIELGHVNVFIGANGSGKSNLLEAIGVLGAAAEGRIDDTVLLKRGVRPGIPALYKSAFSDHAEPSTISLSAKSASACYSVELSNPSSKPRPNWRYSSEELRHGRASVFKRPGKSLDHLNPEAGYAALKRVDLKQTSATYKLLESLQDYAIFTPNTATLRGLVPDPQQRDPIGLSGGGLANAFFGAMSQENVAPASMKSFLHLVDWASGFGIRFSSEAPISPSVPVARELITFTDRFMARGRDKITAYDASEGALYVIFCFTMAYHKDSPKLLAIDNFDSALNPRLARALTDTFSKSILRKKNRQVLLTVQNPAALDGLPLDGERVRLFAVDRTNTGRTSVKQVRITEEVIKRAKGGWTLSRMWTTGHLGGVPDI